MESGFTENRIFKRNFYPVYSAIFEKRKKGHYYWRIAIKFKELSSTIILSIKNKSPYFRGFLIDVAEKEGLSKSLVFLILQALKEASNLIDTELDPF